MATKWGIICTGKICHDFVRAVKSTSAHEHVVRAVAASSEEKGHIFADVYDIPIVCSSYSDMAGAPVDVVYIGGINSMHYTIAKEMIASGKPVLCEKPLCTTVKETDDLITLAKEHKVFLMEGIGSRFFPAYKSLKRILENQSVGEVVQIHACCGEQISDLPRIAFKNQGGGAFLNLGVYILQLVILVFGEKPLNIMFTSGFNSNGVDEWSNVILEYEEGKIAVLSTHTKIVMNESASIYGLGGKIELKHPFWAPSDILIKSTLSKSKVPTASEPLNYPNSFPGLVFEIKEVRRCLKEGILESDIMPHQLSLSIAKLRKTILDKLGVHYE